MQLTVVGTGYVGLVAGAGFADFGNDVACVDVDANKIARLQRGEIPIYEPGLEALIAQNVRAGRLRFSTDVASAVRGAEVVLIAVGTPSSADGSADMSAVYAVAETIGRTLAEPESPERPHPQLTVIATKSTVPVGTADRIKAIVGGLASRPFAVASNPEFLKEGDAVNDFMKPDRIIIGSDSHQACEVLRHLYSPFVRTSDRVHVMDARSAELTKYAANALLATRISFMNDLAVLAEKLGADIELVRKGVGADPRIGPKFLFAGPGFGGSCFPKDLAALLYTSRGAGHELALVRAAEDVNARQKRVLGQKVEGHFGSNLAGKTIGVWGLAFKPQTDDIREAPALTLIDDLLRAGAHVRAHDPQAMGNVAALYGDQIALADTMYGAAEGVDALVLVTEWHEYRRPDFHRLKKLMREPSLFDGRNVWDPEEIRDLGFLYVGIGRGARRRDGGS
jgi:UDPglucose 6-dehydrogenase